MSMPLSSSAPTFVCPVKCSRRPLATFLAFCGGWGSTMLPSDISNMLDFLSTVGLCPLLHHREQASPRSEKKFGRSELCRRKFPQKYSPSLCSRQRATRPIQIYLLYSAPSVFLLR